MIETAYLIMLVMAAFGTGFSTGMAVAIAKLVKPDCRYCKSAHDKMGHEELLERYPEK